VDVNLYECIEKERFSYDKVDSSLAQTLDSDNKYDKEACSFTTKKILRKK
jgi:hypothetical protein